MSFTLDTVDEEVEYPIPQHLLASRLCHTFCPLDYRDSLVLVILTPTLNFTLTFTLTPTLSLYPLNTIQSSNPIKSNPILSDPILSNLIQSYAIHSNPIVRTAAVSRRQFDGIC